MKENLDSLLGKMIPYQKAIISVTANIEYNHSEFPIPILYDEKDCDGITSAVIMSKILKKIGNKKKIPIETELIPEYRLHESNAFLDTGSHFLVATDLFVNGKKTIEKLIESNKRLIAIDHHDTWEIITKNLTFEEKEIMKTRFDYFSPEEIYHKDINSNFPSALFAEEMYRLLFNYHPGIELLSALGTLGDNSLDFFPKFKEEVTKKYNFERLNDIKYTVDIILQKREEKYDIIVQDFIKTLADSLEPEKRINNLDKHWLGGIASKEDVNEIQKMRFDQQQYMNSIIDSESYSVQKKGFLPKGTPVYIGELPIEAPISSIANEIQDKEYGVIIFSNKNNKVKLSSRGPNGSKLKQFLKEIYNEDFIKEDMTEPGGHQKAGAGTFTQKGKTYQETKDYLLEKFKEKLYLK